jgi:hypothetical protein
VVRASRIRLENFWSLLKRGTNGTDGERFDIAVKDIVGKRVTFDQLTSKELDHQTAIN